MKGFSILLFLLFASLLHANPDSLLAIAKLEQARLLLTNNKVDDATVCLDEGLTFFRQQDDLSNWLAWHRKTGRVWRKNREDNIKAIEVMQSALSDMWRSPQENKEYDQLAKINRDIGYCFKRTGDFLSVRDHYLEAAKIYDKIGPINFNIARYTLSQLGNAYTRLRDFENAEYYLEKVKNISLANKEWNKWAEACGDLGMMHINNGAYHDAIEVMNEGLELKDSLDAESKSLLLENVGNAYYQIRDYKLALEYSLLAKTEIDNDTFFSSREKLAWLKDVYENLGRIYRDSGRYDEAALYFQQAEEAIKASSHNPSKRDLAIVDIYRGRMYLKQDIPSKALESYQSALRKLLPDFSAGNDLENPTKEKLRAESLISFALEGKGVSLIGMYQLEGAHDLVERAIECFELANAANELLLQTYFLESSKLTAQEDRRWIKESILEAGYLLRQQEKSRYWEEKLFSVSEQSRAVLLLESLEINRSFENKSTDSLRSDYAIINQKIQILEQALNSISEDSENEKDSIATELRGAKEYRANLLARVEEVIPEIGVTSQYNNLITRVQEKLKSDEALIEYFLGEKKLYIFCITKEGFLPLEKDLPAGYQKTIDTLRMSVMNKDANTVLAFAKSASKLYNWFLKDVLDKLPENKKRLTIVADAELNFVPFDLLLYELPQKITNYADLVDHYLIRKYTINSAPSATILLWQKEVKQGRADRSFAGFAPTHDPDKFLEKDTAKQELFAEVVRDGEHELKGALKEVKKAGKIMGGDIFIGEEADKKTFKSIAEDYRILLLSTHSFVDISDPKFTKILFAKKDSTENPESAYMYALELYNMELKADMAVLSACNTGYGKLYQGEGVMNLSRSFFTAGVPATIISLWPVPDGGTKDVMISFFQYIKEGLSKDEALRRSKLDYLDNIGSPSEASPYSWAGFIPAGNMEPLDMDTGVSVSVFWWVGGLLILLLIFVYFRFIK